MLCQTCLFYILLYSLSTLVGFLDFDLDDLNHVLRLSRESSGSGSSVKRLVRFVLQLNDKLQETRNRVKGMDEELDSAQSDIAELKKRGWLSQLQCM